MRQVILAFLLSGSFSLAAQDKGVTPLAAPATATGATRAVVIGVSDYREAQIPDLKYADKDAKAFAAWLQSPAGGAAPAENIQLYTNEQASVFQIAYAIGEITRTSKAGDRAIIYLSGHGDAETDGDANLGFFLAHDSPPNVYWGNALNLRDVQYLVNSMSRKGVQVLLVADACRSGKLAGSDIGGAQATTGQLATQFSNALVLLSCQPDEFSLESEQWGGGRGLFSYHLENALYGMADQNRDQSIDLREVRNHLEERVPAEASPNKQTPLVQGLISTRLATVDPPTLAQHQARVENFSLAIKNTGGRTLESFPDSLLYHQFLTAIETGRLMAPAGESANDYYERIVSNPEWSPYHGQVKRKFVVALADEAQQVVNKLLRTDPKVADDAFPGRVRYAHLPAYLARAGEILGEEHYLYRYLKAKQYFFEAKTYTKAQYPGLSPDSLFRLSNEALDKGLAYDQEAAYIHLEKGVALYWKAQPRMAAASFDKALQLSPAWVLAIYYHARAIDAMGDRPAAVRYLKEALRYDSTFLPVYERLGFFANGPEQLYWRNEYVRRMEEWRTKDPDNIPATYYRYQGLTLHYLGRNEEAEKYLLRGAEMTNWEDPLYYKQLGMVYSALGRRADMCRCYEKFYEMQPYNPESYGPLVHCGKGRAVLKFLMQQYQRDTANLDALYDLYNVYSTDHQFNACKRNSRRILEMMEALSVYDDNLEAKGNDYWWNGSPDKAEAAFREYIRQTEASGDSVKIKGMGARYGAYSQLACVKMIQGDWQEAQSWWLKGGGVDAGKNLGYDWRTWIAFSRGEIVEADNLLERAITHRLINFDWLLTDVLCLSSIYDLYDYSIFCLEKAVKHYPDHTIFQYHLARLYLEQKNDYEKGVPLLERAVELDSTFTVARYHLAAACARLGRNDAALEHLQKALELGYDDRESIGADARWTSLRETAAYRALIGRYLKE